MAKIPCLLLTFAAILAAQKPGSSVGGNVLNSLTHEPVKRAIVRLQATNGASTSAIADDAGKFAFDAINPGEYVVSAMAQGYSRGAQKSVTVGADQKAAATLALLPGGIISGKVLDADGDPVANATVQALAYNYAQGAPKLKSIAAAVTNDRGEYRISGLVPRRYRLLCSAPSPKPEPQGRVHRPKSDTEYAATYYPASLDPSSAAPVVVSAGAEAGGMDIRRQRVPLFHVRGKVTGLPAQSTSRIGVGLSDCDGGDEIALSVISLEGPLQSRLLRLNGDIVIIETPPKEIPLRPDGTFDLPRVPPGRYCVTINTEAGFARRDITIAGKDVDNVTLTPARPFLLRGSAVFEGTIPDSFDNVRVMLSAVDLEWGFKAASVNPDGSFAVENTLPLTYGVNLQIPDIWYVRTVRLGGQEFADGFVPVTSDAEPLTVTLASDTGQLSGTVKTASGDPVSGMVAVVPLETPYRTDHFRNGNSAEQGRFTVTGLPPGEYQVFALEELDMTAIASPEYRQALQAKGARVTVHPNGRESVDLTLISVDETAAALGKVQ